MLNDAGVALVGTVSLDIDGTDGSAVPAHTTLLATGAPIIEHLRGPELLPSAELRLPRTPSTWSGSRCRISGRSRSSNEAVHVKTARVWSRESTQLTLG